MSNPYEPPKTKEASAKQLVEGKPPSTTRMYGCVMLVLTVALVISFSIIPQYPGLDSSVVYLLCLGVLVLFILSFKWFLAKAKRGNSPKG